MTDPSNERLSKADAQALRKQAADLRRSIVEVVLTSTDLPDAEAIRMFRTNHAQQQKAVVAAKERAAQLEQAHAELKPLEDDLRGKQQARSKAQSSLQEFFRPLGQASFQALLEGNVKDQPLFADRLALQQRMDNLQKEHDSLAPAAEAGAIEKTKAKAQQLAVAGKLKLEEMKIGKLETQIGQQLIEQNQEGAVRCGHTDHILGQIGVRRSEIARLAEQETESHKSLTTKAGELVRALDLSQIEGTHTINEELKRCKADLVRAERTQGELNWSENSRRSSWLPRQYRPTARWEAALPNCMKWNNVSNTPQHLLLFPWLIGSRSLAQRRRF